MPAPTFALATTGTDPKYTAKGILENEVNRVIGEVFDQANPEDRISAEAAAVAAASDAAAAAVSEFNAATSASSASASATEATLAAFAAGAPLYTDSTLPAAVVDRANPYQLHTSAGTQVYSHDGTTATLEGWLGKVAFASVTEFLVYSGPGRGAGAIWEAGGHRYEEAAPEAPDHHLTLAGDVKVYVLPTSSGHIIWEALGPVSGAAEHTALFSALFAAMARAGTKIATFGPGTWRSSYVTVPEGFEARCCKWLTIFKPPVAATRAIFTLDSGSPTAFVKGPTFIDATFAGAEAAPTFAEQNHLITIHGVDVAWFLGCDFIGWRGDALYLGSSDTGSTERHNKNVFVLRCRFDGVNKENRQAISILDCDGLWVQDNTFVRCTKSTMPGVIDFEPNPGSTWAIIRNAWIERNKFDDCGGNVGCIGIVIPSGVPLPHNINILNNTARNLTMSSSAGFFGCKINRVPTAADIDMAVRIEGNDARDCTLTRPYQIVSGKGIRASGNVYADMELSSIVGFSGGQCADVSIKDTFIRCGSLHTQGLYIFGGYNFDISGSTFEDCGDGSAGACAIRFGTGTSSDVKLNYIRITSPTGKTQRAVQKEVGHTFTPATNQHIGCQWGDLINEFQSHESDTLWTNFTPIAEGGGTAGVGSYSYQHGRWRRLGGQVFFTASIIQTSHTGAGVIELSIPLGVPSVSGNPLQMVIVLLGGVTSSGGQSGGINPAAGADGIAGAIRCFSTGTGAKAGINLPTGAATYEYSGTYMAAAA